MGLKPVISLAIITLLSSCSAGVISQDLISSVLQDIMSPANTGKAMQLINMATSRASNTIAPDIARTVTIDDCGLPARGMIARNEMQLPGRIIADEMGVPRAILTNGGIARIISNEPRINPEMLYPAQRQVVRQVVRETPNMVESLFLPREIYQSALLAPQENFAYPCRLSASSPQYFSTTSTMPNPYLPVASPAPNPYLTVASPAPSPFSLFGAPNPYLPVASPVSAMSSPSMPPPTQSKGQFLRKIPIPPPTL